MKIRLAQVTDIEAITEIYNEAILNTVATFDTDVKSIEDRKNWFNKHGGALPVYVAEIATAAGRRIVGWASLSLFSERCAYSTTIENSVYVNPEFHGQRVGTALMEALLSHARQHRFHTIIARIAGGNESSLRLHQRFGFEHIGVMREVGMKFGRLLDVHFMQVLLK